MITPTSEVTADIEAGYLEDCDSQGGFEPTKELLEETTERVLAELYGAIDSLLATATRRHIRRDALLRLVSERLNAA